MSSGKRRPSCLGLNVKKNVNFAVTELVDLLCGNDKSARQDNPLGLIAVLSLTRFSLNQMHGHHMWSLISLSATASLA